MTKPTRSQEREINDLENWIATVNEYLTVLEEQARHARSDAQARSIDRKIKAQVRRLSSLKQRRRALQDLLSPKRKE